MQLARDGILQFPSGPTTASLTIYNDSGGGLNNCAWTKNGVTQSSIPNGSNIVTTLNAGDTFTVYASSILFGATVEYYLNGNFVTAYFGDPIATTPTLTAAGGNSYVFSCYEGA
jgi:hypothetical protein